MTEPTIHVDGVSKRYVKFSDTPTLVGRALQLRNRTRRSELWALRDVTLDANQGECIGVIGRNGSGKSTLLRLLAGVTAPTLGSVSVRGRVAPLIAVGVGFHPELTGRENVFLSSAILGTSRAQTEKLFDDIVDFADIGEFIDTPVKFYSSGMYVRLGFSVAVAIEPEVLLVDEVLAVGDIGFQLRCFNRIEEIQKSGTTIVIVSHNLNAINRLCDRTSLIDDGELVYTGDTSTAISRFHQTLATSNGSSGKAPLRLLRSAIVDDRGNETHHVPSSTALRVTLEMQADHDIANMVIVFQVVSENGVLAYSQTSRWASEHRLSAGDSVSCAVNLVTALTTGSYDVRIGAADHSGNTLLPQTTISTLYVDGARRAKGIADLQADFEISPGSGQPERSEPR